jgi:GNAT superfamily N-acetyltransferase
MTMSTEFLRTYRSADAAACCEVIAACLPQLTGLNEAARAYAADQLMPERLDAELAAGDTLVCEREGTIVGVGCLVGEEIKRLYIAPTAQRQGIGRALLAQLEALARARGVRILRLDAGRETVAFYRRLGLRVVKAAEIDKGAARFRVVRMVKDLAL